MSKMLPQWGNKLAQERDLRRGLAKRKWPKDARSWRKNYPPIDEQAQVNFGFLVGPPHWPLCQSRGRESGDWLRGKDGQDLLLFNCNKTNCFQMPERSINIYCCPNGR